jgi:hypothetical protein
MAVMKPAAGTKTVEEPPPRMLLTPLDSASTGIPAHPNLPQDPKMLKR